MKQMTKLIRLLAIFAAALFWSANASALTQTQSPGSCTNDNGFGTRSWSNSGNARTNNGSYATVSLGDNQVSNYLWCDDFGFTIPAGSTINGITVRVDRRSSNTNTEQDAAMRMVKAGAVVGNDNSTATIYTTTSTYENHGGSTDLWGTTWTVAQINATNFGSVFASQKNGTSGGSRTVSVDHIEIIVDYSSSPSVVSINRASANPTAPATAVAWTVVFDQSVTGVNAADFSLVQTGVTGASITSVTGAGTTWTVNVNTGSGSGTLGLNLVDDDTIINGSGTSIGGTGTGNGNFTGQAYSIPAPNVVSIVRASANPTSGATTVSWTVTFDKSVTGVDAGDFSLVAGGGVTGATITSVTGAGTTWTVNAGTWTGLGTLGLNLVDNDTIVDGASLRLGGTGLGNGNFTGEVYSVTASYCSPPGNTPVGVTVTCVCDLFGRASLNPSTIFGGNWAVSTSDTTGILPYINGTTGLLRITERTASNAKAVTVPSIFPAAGNYISVEFNHYAYNATANPGADGIAITLSDYSIPATPGGFGGSLGYAQRNDGVLPPGFAGGWVGIAIDEYGNFQSPTEGRILGPGRIIQSVGVRGPGNGANGYRYMGGTASSPGGITIDNWSSATPAPGHMYQVIVDARNSATGTINVNVNRDSTTKDGTNYTSLFGPFNAYTEANYALGQGWINKIVPDYWKVSFTGSTGGSNNIHEIGGLRICAQTVAPATGGIASGYSVIDEAYPIEAGKTIPSYPNFSTGQIYMKLAGTPFKLWVAALTSTGISTAYSAVSNKFLQVKLVDNTDNACGPETARTCDATCTNKAAVEAGGSQVITMVNSDKGGKLSADFTLNSSYKKVLAIVKECTTAACSAFTATAPACSADTFSVRPTGIATVTSNANNTNTTATGTPVFKAGSGNFNLIATTTGVAGFPSGYTGNLKINTAAAMQPLGAVGNVLGTLSSTVFPAAVSATPSSTASATTLTYSEAGAFRLLGYAPGSPAANDTLPRGVYDGVDAASECVSPTDAACDLLRAATWTGVDSLSTKGDCVINSYSNIKGTALGEVGKYGCNFGNIANTATIGRFIPDHYDTVVSNGFTCPSGTASPCPALFNGFVFSGQSFTTTVTARNFTGGITTNYDNARGFARPVTLEAWDGLGSAVTQNPPAATPGTPTSGFSAAAAAFTLGVTTTAPTPVYTLPNAYPSPTPPPGPTSIYLRAKDTVDGVTSLRGVSSVEGGIRILSGRLTMNNVYGSELRQLPVGVTAQYWDGSRYTTADTYTFTIPVANVGLGNCLKNLNNGGTTCKPSVAVSTAINPFQITNGVGRFILNPPGLTGSVDMTINGFSFLPSTTNRATFGVYKAGPIIYIRELY